MNKLLALFILILISLSCQQQNSNSHIQDESVQQSTASETPENMLAYYGEKITEDGALPTSKLIAAMEDKDSLQIKLSGEILSGCQMKGCWMKVGLPDSEMRVTFKHYEFFIPKEGVKGKQTIIDGYAKVVETDIETLKHFAKDAGKSQGEIDQITTPKKEITFVASGVIIK